MKLRQFELDEKEMILNASLEVERLIVDDLKSQRQLEIASYASDDRYVKRTRPWILRKLFTLVCAYVLYAPLVVIAVHSLKIIEVNLILKFLSSTGSWLFGTFATAYIGYAGARSIDKRHPEYKNGTSLINKIIKKSL